MPRWIVMATAALLSVLLSRLSSPDETRGGLSERVTACGLYSIGDRG